MNFSYKFQNVLGTVYTKGNLTFSNDGDSILSPVANRISIFDLKNNKSETLPIENRFNFSRLTLSPDGFFIIAVGEDGEASLISLVSQTVLYQHRFNKKVRDIKFSPDGKYFAVTKDEFLFLFKSPKARGRQLNAFLLLKVFKGSYGDTVCIDWSSDSRIVAVGSKDMCTRVYAVEKFKNFFVYTLGGHTDSIVACFFVKDSLNLFTISRNGQLCVWEYSFGLDGLIVKKWRKGRKKKNQGSDEEDDVAEGIEAEVIEQTKEDEKEEKARYIRLKREYIGDDVRKHGAHLSAADFHKETSILVTGFSNGAFFLHELPDMNLIHSLSITDQHITTLVFNVTGEWIGIGCKAQGQLLVWEWQSESYIMKQQGHYNSMNCIAYSPDGLYLATGGDDSKLKLWRLDTGFCFVTFPDHQANITGVAFCQAGKVIVSSSLDGTVRAFDLNRYRNFRTFTAPRMNQFSCLAVDLSGEFVCAGSQDSFEIFVWSMQTGRLLEVLSGHQAPVSSLTFTPNQTTLISGSWDGNVRFWDVFESKDTREVVTMTSDVLALAIRPDGKELAVATLDANISFFNIPSLDQTRSIEGRRDLRSGRRETDFVTANTVLKGKAFTAISYSADGQHILAAGQSKNICIYNVAEQILVKRFEISQNKSFDGMDDFINRRKMTEFGNKALIEYRDDEDEPVKINLPGVKTGDMSSRAFKPEVRVTGVTFSPTGRSWAASTTEGVLIYSLDRSNIFDPFDLDIKVTPSNTRKLLERKDFLTAIIHASKLNDKKLLAEVFEKIPVDHIKLLSRNIHMKYVERILKFLGSQLEKSKHLEFYLLWIQSLLVSHGQILKSKSMSLMSTFHFLQKSLIVRYSDLRTICEYNKYTLSYIEALGSHKRKNPDDHVTVDEDECKSDEEMME